MPNNNRVFWACRAVFTAPHGDDGSFPYLLKGVQSVGITTTFNLEEVFELGQLGLYENIEDVPDVEITIEKVLDGHSLIYEACTFSGGSIINRSNDRADVFFMVGPDTGEALNRVVEAPSPAVVSCSGMFVSSVSYTLPNEGNCTESVTLVGNDKRWYHNTATAGILPGAHAIADLAPTFVDAAAVGSNMDDFGDLGVEHRPGVGLTNTPVGVARRQDVNMLLSFIPADVFGVDKTKANLAAGAAGNRSGAVQTSVVTAGNNWSTSLSAPRAHLVNITVSTDLGREELNELGRRGPYHRYVSFPIEVTCDIECYTVSGDMVDARSETETLKDEKIFLYVNDATSLDLGTKNKLSSVSYTGGDTGGGNATVTYSYSNFNSLEIVSPGGARGAGGLAVLGADGTQIS